MNTIAETSQLGFDVAVEVVTPDTAKAYLNLSSQNRNPIARKVSLYARQMRQGLWRLTHQGIAFNASGMLIDGQHRLLAVIESGVHVKMCIFRGVDDDSMASLDSGARRSAAQSAKIIGLDAGNFEMAVAKAILLNPAEKPNAIPELSNVEIIKIFEKHESAIRFACQTHVAYSAKPVKFSATRAAVARAWYSSQCTKERLAQFIYVLDTGIPAIDAAKDSSALSLRNWILNNYVGRDPAQRFELYQRSLRAVVYFNQQRENVKIVKPMYSQPFPVESIDGVPIYLLAS